MLVEIVENGAVSLLTFGGGRSSLKGSLVLLRRSSEECSRLLHRVEWERGKSEYQPL